MVNCKTDVLLASAGNCSSITIILQPKRPTSHANLNIIFYRKVQGAEAALLQARVS